MKTIMCTLCIAMCVAFGCADSEEAATVPRAVQVDGAGVTEVTNDLGYTVRLTRARAVVDGVAFTRSSLLATRATPRRGLLGWILGTAHAHPGHEGAGDVVGALSGRYVIDWIAADGASLGTAELLDGGFDGARFLLTAGTTADGLAEDDPLIGHAFELAGVASKDGVETPFSAAIRLDEATLVEGIPPLDGAQTQPIHGLRFVTQDPFEGDTLFDGIDFETEDLAPGSAGYNRLLRAVRSHDHYLIAGDTP